MKKRMLSMMLVLALVLSMVPAVVSAELETVTRTDKAGSHTADHKCEECGEVFAEWTSGNSLPAAGHYYLTKDVTLTAERQVTGKLHLCLNGYVIKAAAGKRVFNTKGDTATELVLTDCTAYTDAAGVYHAGAVTGGQDKSAGGGAVFVRRLGVVKVYDGRITQNTSTVAGGAVALQAKSGSIAAGKFYMYGGEMSYNTALAADGTTYKNGGGIYTGSGSVVELSNAILSHNTAISGGVIYTGAMGSPIKLTNCVIEGNTATGAEAGGAFYSAYATFQLSGCEITENKAPNGGGAAIWAKTSGEFQLTNCTVKGNEAKNAGGVIYIKDKVNLTVTGSSFTENKSGSAGSVLYYQNYCQVSLKDTTITGNASTNTHADGYSAAIFGLGGSSKLTLSGKMIVADNSIKSPNTADINFNNADTDIVYVNELSEGSRVFFSTKKSVAATAADVVALGGTQTAWNDNWLTFMNENGEYKQIGYENGQFVFSKGHAHNGCNDAGCTDHEELTFKAWTNSTSLPASGSWYLDTDVTVSKETRLAGTLNLCLNGKTITGQTASARIYSTTADQVHVLNISDCTATTVDGVYTAGKITGSHNTNTGAGGGAIMLRAGGTMRLFDGIICDNSTVSGGGALFANGATIEMYNGQFSGNFAKNAEGIWKTGGAIYLQDTNMVMYGGEISGNEANDGAGIHMAGKSTLEIRGGVVTGNIAHKEGAGVNMATAASKLTVSGNVQITGNTLSGGKASNLRLRDGNIMELGQLGEEAKLGVSATAFKPISNETDDYSENFFSDDARFEVIYKDKVLQLTATGDHKHCLCANTSTSGCDHQAITFAPWEDATSLPSTGNYYLTVDVTVAARTNLENTTLRLCLNGHTITVGQQGGRVYRMYSESHLYLTDCAETAGSITGATQSAILSDNAGTNMTIDFWRISFTGNHAQSPGGAIIAQSDTTVNMHSGSITGNSSIGYLKVDAAGKPILDANGNQTYASGYGGGLVLLGGTFNMYSGQIFENKTEAVPYVKADGTTANAGGQGGGIYIRGTANLYGGVIQNNTAHTGGGISSTGEDTLVNLMGTEVSYNSAVSGGGVIIQGRSDGVMTAGIVKNNKTTDSGAGVYVSTGSVLTLKGGKISGNEATKNGGGVAVSGKEAKLIVEDFQISSNKAKNAGGIYSQTYATVELHGAKIQNNYASASGGGVYSATNATFIMTGGSVNNNTTDGDVGGVMCLRGTAKITGGAISNNVGANTGGLKIYGTNANISGLSIVGNRAIGKPSVNAAGKVTYTGGSGCGLMVAATSYTQNGVKTDYIPVVNISNIYVANNKANGSAAGILVQSKGVVFNMSNSTLTGNEAATGAGGAMYIASNVTATLKNLKVTNNKASTAGGINLYGCVAEVDGLVVTGNESAKGGAGITVVAKTADVTMKNMDISSNTAGGAGGGLVVQTSATLHLSDSKIYGNTTTSLGGGVYFSAPSYGTFRNVEIYENTAVRDGGGINLYANCELTMEGVTLRDNTSETVGGGIFCRGRLEATNCKFLNNQAPEGGGIATAKSAGDDLRDRAGAFVVSSVISGNEATGKGGGVYNHRGGPIYLTDSMITDNKSTAEGSAIYADGRLGLENVTVTGNTAENNGYAIFVTSAEYDGHTYIAGHKKLSGEVIVKDNQGGDMFLNEGAILAVTGEQLGEKTHVAVTVPSGVLSQYVLGVYGYEGGDQHYIITAGDRSITDPERVAEPEETQPQTQGQKESGNTLLYVGIGVIALIAIGAMVLVILKKKKSPAGETK